MWQGTARRNSRSYCNESQHRHTAREPARNVHYLRDGTLVSRDNPAVPNMNGIAGQSSSWRRRGPLTPPGQMFKAFDYLRRLNGYAGVTDIKVIAGHQPSRQPGTNGSNCCCPPQGPRWASAQRPWLPRVAMAVICALTCPGLFIKLRSEGVEMRTDSGRTDRGTAKT